MSQRRHSIITTYVTSEWKAKPHKVLPHYPKVYQVKLFKNVSNKKEEIGIELYVVIVNTFGLLVYLNKWEGGHSQ